MRTVAWLRILVLAAPLMSAGERVFTLAHTSGERDAFEAAVALRAILEIPDVSAEATARTLTVKGTDAQIGIAAWLVQEIDRPAATTSTSVEKREMRVGEEDRIGILFLSNTPEVVKFQEAATLIRSIGELRRVFTYSTPRAMILRGTPQQLALADWLARELMQGPSAGIREFAVASGDVVRLLYLAPPDTSGFQELATVIRSTLEIRRAFTYNATRALAVRATPEQAAAAAWMSENIPKGAGSPEYRLGAGDVVRLLFLTKPSTIAEFQAAALSIRRETRIPALFTHNSYRAVVVRGTGEQAARAEQLSRQWQ